MSTEIDKERLIARYLNGELSDGDAAELLDWIQLSDENKRLFLEIKDVWDTSKSTSFNETEQLLHFYRRQTSRTKPRKLSVWVSGWAVAAVLLVGLLLGNLFHISENKISSQIESFVVPMGARSEVLLADGTKVTLNSNSSLVLDENFSSKKRSVTLDGEGYFEVKSDKNHPFLVKTQKFDVTVTGTRFNVSSYKDDQQISATLAEGRIRLTSKDHKTIVLEPGQKLSFDQKTMEPTLEYADVESEMAWVEGEFNFENIPFPDLIRRLERSYGVTLAYDNTEFMTLEFTGRFTNQETIWQVLDALKLIAPLDYKKRNFREFELIYKPM